MTEKLIKSANRVKNHGEVFTPKRIVDRMLNQPEITEKVNDLYATFLEPSAGEGAFLVELLKRKINVAAKMSELAQQFNKNSLIALSTLYGIEYLEDNVETLVMNMILTFSNVYHRIITDTFNAKPNPKVIKRAEVIMRANMAQGDTLKKVDSAGNPIIFSEWKPVRNKPTQVQRTEYTFEAIINQSGPTNNVKGATEEMDLFTDFGYFDSELSDQHSKHYLPCNWLDIYKQKME